VVLLLPYENDLFWCGETAYTTLEKPRFTAEGELEERALTDNSGRSWFADTAIGSKLIKRDQSVPLFQPGSRPIPKEFGIVLDELPEFMEDPIARATGAMRALVTKCDELGAELVVAAIPSESAIHEGERIRLEEQLGLSGIGWSGDNSVDRFNAVATSAGVPAERILDVRPHFRARDEAGDVLYFAVDWHLNDLGNQELAVFLAEQLAALGLTPAKEGPLPAMAARSGGMPAWLPWYLGLWILLGTCYASFYRQVEKPPIGFLKVGGLLALVFLIAVGGTRLIGMLPPAASQLALVLVILVILAFVAYKLGDRLGTITELLTAFIARGHWYLMPLVVVLLTVGSLLVVAASSPLVAPFIYTLF